MGDGNHFGDAGRPAGRKVQRDFRFPLSGLQVEFDELMGSLRGLSQVDQILERAGRVFLGGIEKNDSIVRESNVCCSFAQSFKSGVMDDKERRLHVDQMRDEFLHGVRRIQGARI